MKLAVDCYGVTKSFPREEAFGMTSQIRRASVSIAANIAEGYGRESTASFIQFLRISQGSQKELETHIILSERVGLLTAEIASTLLRDVESIGRMLRNLIRSLENKVPS
jgi:four helix bundle protein